jgi:hypothetical protein
MRRAQWPLLEKEVIRFAESLDDYEHVSVTDIGSGPANVLIPL